jgi:D-sedoheptulose 7-phosphate isomerase
MSKSSIVKTSIQNSIKLKSELLNNEQVISDICKAAERIIDCYKNGDKVVFCGNGGSAADAQHLSAELSGRFYYDRPPLAAEALHTNAPYVTAVGNDYSFEQIYARLLQASGKKGDVLIALSTSGNSQNIIYAIEEANKLSMTTICLTGKGGGKLKGKCDILIEVPSNDTPRIQECHMLVGHILCNIVEQTMFPR